MQKPILYQLVGLGVEPGGTWLTYSGIITVITAGNRYRTLYAKATHSGMTDSGVVSWDFEAWDNH